MATAPSALARAEDADAVPAGELRVRLYGGEDGLHNLVIASMTQDRAGFIWLGTDDGVYRFDGQQFRHFGVEDGLASSQVTVVETGPDGNVCVGGTSGVVCWNGLRFTHAGSWGVPAVPIAAMVSYGGQLWVGTDHGQLLVQQPAGSFVPAAGWQPQAPGPVHAVFADAAGVVVGDGSAVWTTVGDGAWHDLGDIGLGGERIDSVLRDRSGELWIRTPVHLWHLPAGATRAIDVSDGLPSAYDSIGSPLAMALGPSGDVLVGTDGGVARRERDHWHVLDQTVGLPKAAVRTMLVDRGGTLWLSARGLVELRGRGLLEHYDAERGMPGNVVWSFHRDARGTLWAGTSRCLARAIDGSWECLPATDGRVVRDFVFPPQGGVFIGGAPSDLLYIDPEGRTRSLDAFHRPPEVNILALALGPEGDLWIATKHGLYRLPGAVPGDPVPVDVPGTARDARFASLAVVGDELWTASDTGVMVLEAGRWRRFDTHAGFLAADISYVVARRDGRLCAAYRDALGVTCFRYAGGAVSELEHIGVTEGLTSGRIYLLGEDRSGRLWIGSGDGVDVVTPQGMDHFDEVDGLAGNDSAAGAFLLDRDGSLWLGASGGATHVLAQYYGGPPAPPRTALLGGELGGRPILTADSPREVEHDLGTLTVAYAAADVSQAMRIAYQVRLAGLESAWNDTRQREARYPKLAPGRYRFEVRARIGAGAWGPTTSLDFLVLPAWWQTGWFAALAAAVALGAVGGGFALRQRAVLRRRMRQMAERSDASFCAVIDLMPDLISVYRDRKLIYVNQALRRFLGTDDDEQSWINLTLIDRIHPDDRDPLLALFERVRSAPSAGLEIIEVIEIRARASDGSWRTCETSGVLVEIGGHPTVVATSRDVTERGRMRAKLVLSDRMASLGTLAAGIAHEINNPLAYVTGNLEVAAEALASPGSMPPGELATVIGDARDGADRVRKIVHGLRAFSRAEDEKRVPLALPHVLEAAIRITANEVRHRAELVRDLQPTPHVIADDSRLTQVFINLLVNAAHAIPEGHTDRNRITVRTRRDELGRAVVEIADTGHGMPPEVQARVFDPFFTTKAVGEGTGLGLSICHGIVTGLGGQISVESATGKGTVIRVVLPGHGEVPVAPPPQQQPEPAADAAPPRRPRVLVIDDEPQVAHTIERLLRRDFDVTVALCGRDAMAHIRAGTRFDAIVSDVMMPNMTGIELVEELQRVAPDQAQRLIFLSGGAFTAQARERLDQLGVPQLEKPVTASELRGWLRRITAMSEVNAA
ncbi:MAG TPA: two-component regulator propeller domain-containing protein [Kofleriaceae bacterium]|nr:two-component regulator propeller domain-containing protein [Kofleriaceae bacterium]